MTDLSSKLNLYTDAGIFDHRKVSIPARRMDVGAKMPETEPTIGSYLAKKEGYQTALVGKAHFQPNLTTDEFPSLESMPLLQDLDFWKNFHDPFYGFDHVELARNHTNEFLVGQHYALWMEEGTEKLARLLYCTNGNYAERSKISLGYSGRIPL